MRNLLDLFSLLDGWDEASFPQALELNPDPAITAAKYALSGRGDIASALHIIEEQIDKARPVLRLMRFDLVQEVHAERGWSPDKARRLGSELHELAALLLMRLKRFDEARAHLIHSIACLPENPTPRFRFVELYLEIGAYTAAFDLLNRGLDEAPERMLQLYRLTKDIHERGALLDARKCYERIVELDKNGLFRDLASLQIANIESPTPSDDQLDNWYEEGGDRLRFGDAVAALNFFRNILCWRPEHPTSWFVLGYAYGLLAESANLMTWPDNTAITIVPASMGSDRYELLLKAKEAFRLTILLDPKFTEAHSQLATCYLLLEFPGASLDSILEAAKQSPDDPTILANLSIILLMNGDSEGARDSAQVALALDPENTVARETLAILNKLVDLERTGNDE